MALFDPVWAVDGQLYVPTSAEIRQGFQCGSVNPYVFNYLFQSIEATINSLDTEGMTPMSRRVNTAEGTQGGGTLENDLTIRLAFNGLDGVTDIENTDLIAIFRDGVHYKITRQNFVAGLGGEGGSILLGGENVGTGVGIYKGLDDDTFQLKSLTGTAGVFTWAGGTDEVNLAFADFEEMTVN